MLKFEMPGYGMPDYAQRMAIIAKHAHYGPAEYYKQVVDELVSYWDIARLQPTYPAARAAQAELLAYHERLGRIAARQLRQQNRTITQAEAVARHNHAQKNDAESPSPPISLSMREELG
jgi:hypothetical protein